MLIMDAVLENYDVTGFALWPVADPPADHLLVLSGRLSMQERGTVMAVLTNYNNSDEPVSARSLQNGTWQIRQLLSADRVIAPGGIRIQDTSTGVTAPPGCCFGLENWRDWLDWQNGEEPWLGHDPTPRAERNDTTIRLWPDTELPDGLPIELPLARLPHLLSSVRTQLVAFLDSVEEWATRYAPSLGDALVAKLDKDLAITAPLRGHQS
ncbi:hypothetical protein [Streptomyces longwoodensis]|uniref:hypothetical protein n=1 Tax=Streptomyces longwoodensis TaxID=68231 RepID=UPI00384FBD80